MAARIGFHLFILMAKSRSRSRVLNVILKIHIMKSSFPQLIIFSSLAIFVAGCQPDSSAKPSAPSVSDTLKVPPTDTLAFAAKAKGVQIYECRANKDNTNQYEWVLKAPDADLFDAHGKKIAHHYGGPTWASSDGSKVTGEVRANEPSIA